MRVSRRNGSHIGWTASARASGPRFEKRIPLIADGLERCDLRPLLATQSEGAELEERAKDLAGRNDL